MSLWHLFFDPHLTTHQSSIGVQLRKVPENTHIPCVEEENALVFNKVQ